MQGQALPGFRDFYPEDFAFRNSIFATWREVARRYGFQEYDGPPLEPLELYTDKSGAEIVQQLYAFEDKGGRKVALRPEMTPTLARMVGARAQALKKPIRWFSIPQLFRYERQQRGRLREHFQLNMDIIGEAGPAADAELRAAALSRRSGGRGEPRRGDHGARSYGAVRIRRSRSHGRPRPRLLHGHCLRAVRQGERAAGDLWGRSLRQPDQGNRRHGSPLRRFRHGGRRPRRAAHGASEAIRSAGATRRLFGGGGRGGRSTRTAPRGGTAGPGDRGRVCAPESADPQAAGAGRSARGPPRGDHRTRRAQGEGRRRAGLEDGEAAQGGVDESPEGCLQVMARAQKI